MANISHQMESIGLRMGAGYDTVTPLSAQHIVVPSPDAPSNTSPYAVVRQPAIAKPRRLHSANLPGPVRRRISRACDQCNQLRTKCDGKAPCAHCQEYGLTCGYERERKKASKKERKKASQKEIAQQHAAVAAAANSTLPSGVATSSIPPSQSNDFSSLSGQPREANRELETLQAAVQPLKSLVPLQSESSECLLVKGKHHESIPSKSPSLRVGLRTLEHHISEEKSHEALGPLSLEGNSKDPRQTPTLADHGSATNMMEKCEEVDPTRSDNAVSSACATSESDSSDSTEEYGNSSLLVAERQRVVDRVMGYFYTIFRAVPPVRCSGNDETTNESSQSEQYTSNSPTAPAQKSRHPSSTRLGKRPQQHDDEDRSDDEDDGLPKRPRKGEKGTEHESRKRKFACPYFKRNSERYLTRRSCVGPGWDEVRRVKEHLYRNHALPIFCHRCYEHFKDETMLHDHQRATETCTRRPEKTIEGFDKSQEKKLRSRKKSHSALGEEDKWKDMYRILFPSDNETCMPSPYLDGNWEKIYQRATLSASSELDRYEQFLRRELPPAIRRKLEIAVEKEFSPLEERLKGQLIEIVRDLQLQLFRSYTQIRRSDTASTPETTPTEPIPDSSGGSSSVPSPFPDQVQTPISNHEAMTLENTLASFQPPPPLEDTSIYEFNPVLFQLNDLEEFNDSAYGSMFLEFDSKVGCADGFECFYNLENGNGEGSSQLE